MKFKTLAMLLIAVALMVFMSMIAHAQGVPVVVASPVPPVVVTPNFISNALAFLWGPGGAMLIGAAYALACEFFAWKPQYKANSLSQFLMMGLAKAEQKNPLPGLAPPAA